MRGGHWALGIGHWALGTGRRGAVAVGGRLDVGRGSCLKWLECAGAGGRGQGGKSGAEFQLEFQV